MGAVAMQIITVVETYPDLTLAPWTRRLTLDLLLTRVRAPHWDRFGIATCFVVLHSVNWPTVCRQPLNHLILTH